MLLYAGANAQATTRLGGYTPLHLASKAGKAEVIAALLDHGAKVNATTSTGATALMLAADAGSAERGPDADRAQGGFERRRHRERRDGADVRGRAGSCGRGPRAAQTPAPTPPRISKVTDLSGVVAPEEFLQNSIRDAQNAKSAAVNGTKPPAPAPAERRQRRRRRHPRLLVQRADRQAGRDERAALRVTAGQHAIGAGAGRRRRADQRSQRRRRQPAADRVDQRPVRHREVPGRARRRPDDCQRRRRHAALCGPEHRVGAAHVLSAAAGPAAAEDGVSRDDDAAARQGRGSERAPQPQDLVHPVQLRPAPHRRWRRDAVLARGLFERHRRDEAAARLRRRSRTCRR